MKRWREGRARSAKPAKLPGKRGYVPQAGPGSLRQNGRVHCGPEPPRNWGPDPPEKPPAMTELDSQLDSAISACLAQLAAGDDSARGKLLEICDGRLHRLAHRLLGKFARVRRWDNTDDVSQNAALRLYRALGDTVPDSPRGLMGLMATVIQRELLDLARKHAGAMSYAANHGTNIREGTDGGQVFVVEDTQDAGDAHDEEIPLDRWEAFHNAVEALPDEHREVFKLVWYLGADRETAAKTLRSSVRTVGRRWQEAREMVARAVEAGQQD
jgi:RNA polymerase sigma factor (sigma-70 family)